MLQEVMMIAQNDIFGKKTISSHGVTWRYTTIIIVIVVAKLNDSTYVTDLYLLTFRISGFIFYTYYIRQRRTFMLMFGFEIELASSETSNDRCLLHLKPVFE